MLKRIFLTLFALFSVLSMSSCKRDYDFVSATYTVSLFCENAFVYRFDDGSTRYFVKSETDDVVYPASTTKLLTALTALSILDADTLITPGQEVYEVESGSTSAFIRPHHTLTLEMLIEGMLLPSGNDAAYAIAAACGYEIVGAGATYTEAVQAFVTAMNEYAYSLGCRHSVFTTPDGFANNEHYSTVSDMLLICRAAAENEIILRYSALPSDSVLYASGHTNTWVNTNEMLQEDSPYYEPAVIGLKTGSLEDNYSLVILYDDGETKLLIGVFGAETASDRYKDARTLIEAEKLVTDYVS